MKAGQANTKPALPVRQTPVETAEVQPAAPVANTPPTAVAPAATGAQEASSLPTAARAFGAMTSQNNQTTRPTGRGVGNNPLLLGMNAPRVLTQTTPPPMTDELILRGFKDSRNFTDVRITATQVSATLWAPDGNGDLRDRPQSWTRAEFAQEADAWMRGLPQNGGKELDYEVATAAKGLGFNRIHFLPHRDAFRFQQEETVGDGQGSWKRVTVRTEYLPASNAAAWLKQNTPT